MSEDNYLKDVEEDVQKLREAALKQAQAINPKVRFVVDNRTIGDYSERVWDYPGAWYVYFSLPKGVKNKQQMIEIIVRDTLAYYEQAERKNAPQNVFFDKLKNGRIILISDKK